MALITASDIVYEEYTIVIHIHVNSTLGTENKHIVSGTAYNCPSFVVLYRLYKYLIICNMYYK